MTDKEKEMPSTKRTVVRKTAAAKTAEVAQTQIADAHEVPSAYIPPKSVAENYVGRKLSGGVWDIQVLDTAFAHGFNVLLQGDTGAGKTMLGEAYAAVRGLRYYSIPCDVSIDPSALFGKMVPTEVPGKFRWQDGPATQIFREGGVMNISEINFMPPKIAASLYPALDARRYIPLLAHKGEVVRAHIGTEALDDKGNVKKCWCSLSAAECNSKRVLIIADMNPQYRGTMDLNAAFKNRFKIKEFWGYSDEVEEKLVKSPALRETAKKLRALSGTEIMTPVSTNMMMEFERFAGLLNLEFAKSNFVNAFDTDERPSVEKVMELQLDQIKKDLEFFAGNKGEAVAEEEMEEIDFEFEMDV